MMFVPEVGTTNCCRKQIRDNPLSIRRDGSARWQTANSSRRQPVAVLSARLAIGSAISPIDAPGDWQKPSGHSISATMIPRHAAQAGHNRRRRATRGFLRPDIQAVEVRPLSLGRQQETDDADRGYSQNCSIDYHRAANIIEAIFPREKAGGKDPSTALPSRNSGPFTCCTRQVNPAG